eukprot:1937072-Pyramimonas_sp.AAC.1
MGAGRPCSQAWTSSRCSHYGGSRAARLGLDYHTPGMFAWRCGLHSYAAGLRGPPGISCWHPRG